MAEQLAPDISATVVCHVTFTLIVRVVHSGVGDRWRSDDTHRRRAVISV